MHRRKKRKLSAEPKLAVKPSESIDERVWSEIRKAEGIIQTLEKSDYLASPYLVSAIYYHDGLLDDFEDKPTADPAGRIVAHISRALTPDLKSRFIARVERSCASEYSELGPTRLVPPLSWQEPARGVKGGVKIDRWGVGKIDHLLGSLGFVFDDLRGRLERRPATRLAGRV